MRHLTITPLAGQNIAPWSKATFPKPIFSSTGHSSSSSRTDLPRPRVHCYWRLSQRTSKPQAMRATRQTDGRPAAGGAGDWERRRCVLGHGGVWLGGRLSHAASQAGPETWGSGKWGSIDGFVKDWDEILRLLDEILKVEILDFFLCGKKLLYLFKVSLSLRFSNN